LLTLGIDPGTAITGYGIVRAERDDYELLDYGVITTSANLPLAERLRILYQELSRLIEVWQPDDAAVEQLFFSRNARTALAVGHGRGVILLALANANLPISEYTPGQVKQAVVGYGRGQKGQIQEMVRLLLGMESIPTPDDAADALAVAICHIHHRRTQHLIAAAT
jgi:crossover junction endodeoxyribonuclease RuvC